jgi:predicted ATP-grasp superfamily ATP-dependent carboligase
MLTALVADLAAIGQHEIVATADPRYPPVVPAGVQVATLRAGARVGNGAVLDQLDRLERLDTLDTLIGLVDAVWLIAPETGRCLERLAARAERKGRVLLGTGATGIRRASDKAELARRLAARGVPHPATRVLRGGCNARAVARELERPAFPVVVKPRRGAGCTGVSLARDRRELERALALARRADGMGPILVQRYVPGVAASVSLLTDGSRSVPLTLNLQRVQASQPFSYLGGTTPLDHPLGDLAIETALRACEAMPGLRGWIGVDMVLTQSQAVVIEVNPRLTTAYLGVRRAIEGNAAELALAALAGAVPVRPPVRRRVRFTAGGLVSVAPLRRRPLECRRPVE